MQAVGIICEYNPFHNGHLYHMNEVKKLFPNHVIVLILSGPFSQRGDVSILTKWEKTEIALTYGVDLVIELPFIFATGSADLFAEGAITILKDLKVQALVFGSEENNISKLKKLATIQFDACFQEKVKQLTTKHNYPTAISKTLKELTGMTVTAPNDILGIAYIKEIIKQSANIRPVSIQRTTDYHEDKISGPIASATSIRKAIVENKDIREVLPEMAASLLHSEVTMDSFYPFFQYKLISEKEMLYHYHEMTENLLPRFEKAIDAKSFDEFILKVKSKKETYNKIKRICLYLLCGLTTTEAEFYKKNPYIRILGFSLKGQQYLNTIKKKLFLPVFTNYSNDKLHLLKLDQRVHQIYVLGFPVNIRQKLLKEELQKKPIIKQ